MATDRTVPAGGSWYDESVSNGLSGEGDTSASTSDGNVEDWQSQSTLTSTLSAGGPAGDGAYYFNVKNDHEGHKGGQPPPEEGWDDDEYADQEVDTLRTRALKFTRVDRRDPRATVQLSMGGDLGLYLGTKTSKRRVDTVAPGVPGALAVYSSATSGPNRGQVVAADWTRAEQNDATGERALRFDADLIARDMVIHHHGSLSAALAELGANVAAANERQQLFEGEIERLSRALVESEAQVQALAKLMTGTARIRVEHGPGSDPDAWVFSTAVRNDGTSTLAVQHNGRTVTGYCARPLAPIADNVSVAVGDAAAATTVPSAPEAPAAIGQKPLPTVPLERAWHTPNAVSVVPARQVSNDATDTADHVDDNPEVVETAGPNAEPASTDTTHHYIDAVLPKDDATAAANEDAGSERANVRGNRDNRESREKTKIALSSVAFMPFVVETTAEPADTNTADVLDGATANEPIVPEPVETPQHRTTIDAIDSIDVGIIEEPAIPVQPRRTKSTRTRASAATGADKVEAPPKSPPTAPQRGRPKTRQSARRTSAHVSANDAHHHHHGGLRAP